jgi:hypothetical protein
MQNNIEMNLSKIGCRDIAYIQLSGIRKQVRAVSVIG